MTVYEFGLLCISTQVGILYEQGVYVGKRNLNKRCVVLYQLDSFYVEIFYKKYRKHIHCIRCFVSVDEVDDYLKQINIEELVRVC